MKRLHLPALGVATLGLLGLSLRAQAPAVNDAARAPALRSGGWQAIDGRTNPELLATANAVTKLLETGDVDAFVAATSASLDDWKRLAPAGGDLQDLSVTERLVARRERAINTSASHVLELARRAGLAPGRVKFTVKSISAVVQARTTRFGGQPVTQAFAPELSVVLTARPLDEAGGKSLRGDYRLALGNARRFADGWRTEDGVRWVALPETLADEATQHELALANLAAPMAFGRIAKLGGADDPALRRLGETVATLLRAGAVRGFVDATTLSIDELIQHYLSIDSPAASAADDRRDQMVAGLTGAAQAVVDLQRQLGADFSDAKLVVKQVLAERLSFTCYGDVQGLRAGTVRVTFTVASARNAKSGRSLAGDYTVWLGEAMRVDQRWVLMDDTVRFQDFPAGLVAGDDLKRVELENYVAEYHALPPGHTVPEVTLVTLAGTPLPLASLRGKVVVLEFWASWCGPCQEPMEKLQHLREDHPEWRDRVAVVAVSIDAQSATARTHLEKRGWTSTLNAWAGEGAWDAPAMQAFRVRSLPTAYVLDRDGKVAKAGALFALNVAQVVDAELRKSGE